MTSASKGPERHFVPALSVEWSIREAVQQDWRREGAGRLMRATPESQDETYPSSLAKERNRGVTTRSAPSSDRRLLSRTGQHDGQLVAPKACCFAQIPLVCGFHAAGAIFGCAGSKGNFIMTVTANMSSLTNRLACQFDRSHGGICGYCRPFGGDDRCRQGTWCGRRCHLRGRH